MNGLVVEAVRVVATGLVGAVVYDGVKRVTTTRVIHGATVTGTEWGLRGFRAVEAGAEKARLATGDIVSEARARIGEEAPAPGAANGHGHVH